MWSSEDEDELGPTAVWYPSSDSSSGVSSLRPEQPTPEPTSPEASTYEPSTYEPPIHEPSPDSYTSQSFMPHATNRQLWRPIPTVPPPPPPLAAPTSSPSPPCMKGDEDIMTTLSNLEDDAAYLENDLFILKYVLEGLFLSVEDEIESGEGLHTVESIRRESLQILSELRKIGHELPALVERCEEAGADLKAIGQDEAIIDQGKSIGDLRSIDHPEEASVNLKPSVFSKALVALFKQHVIIDKTLTAAKEMRKELKELANNLKLRAPELEWVSGTY